MADPSRAPSRVLIVGASGSAGSYLAEHIAAAAPTVEVHGTTRWHSTTDTDNLASVRDRMVLHECDLTDLGSVQEVVAASQPDAVFNLASHANVHLAFRMPLAVLQNNVMGTANLLEAIHESGLGPVVVHASSAKVYGQVKPEDVPIREEQPLRPCGPYGVSKMAQEGLVGSYHRCHGMRTVCTRMFGYVNPRRADLFASSFARQVARIELGLQDELTHGNLEAVQTLVDIRDAAASGWLAALHGEPGETYNVGSTDPVSVGQLLERLRQRAAVPIPCRVDPALLRPVDLTMLVPAVEKFAAATGWRPARSLEETIDFLLDTWRARVRRAVGADAAEQPR